MDHETPAVDVVVAGGGLAGLAAATYLARGGQRVVLFEKARQVGGRAMTRTTGGFHLNMGPHALYGGGQAELVLRELGVTYSGRKVSTAGALALRDGVVYSLPSGPVSLAATRLLGWPEKMELARFFAAVPWMKPDRLQATAVREWLAWTVRHDRVREIVVALIRTTSYGYDPDRQSAGAALAQIQLAVRHGVTYLDGGWQTLVEGLRSAAEQAGVRIATGARVVAVEADPVSPSVRLADGTTCEAAAVVIAAGPRDAAALLGPRADRRIGEMADHMTPLRLATLDLGLTRLPRPRTRVALGIDRPLYFSVHSAYARLAPAGAAVIHAAKYLPVDQASDPVADEREIEAMIDLVQPGWRECIAARRFLPEMVVTNALPTADAGGTAGRPGPDLPDAPNVYVAGDWVGGEGVLADAVLASAKRAAGIILRHAGRVRPERQAHAVA